MERDPQHWLEPDHRHTQVFRKNLVLKYFRHWIGFSQREQHFDSEQVLQEEDRAGLWTHDHGDRGRVIVFTTGKKKTSEYKTKTSKIKEMLDKYKIK